MRFDRHVQAVAKMTLKNKKTMGIILGYQSQGDEIFTMKQWHGEVQVDFREKKMQSKH